MITLQTADNALKSFYLDAVKDSIDMKANPLLAKIEKTTQDVYGKDVKKLFRRGFASNVCAGTETGDLPATNSNDYGVMVSTLKNLYGTLEISDKALRAAQGGDGAFVNLLNDEMQHLIKSASFNLGRMLFGDGSGKLANVLEVDADTMFVDSVNCLVEGMNVYFYNSKGERISNLASKKIQKIDRVNKTVYFNSDDLLEIKMAGVTLGCTVSLQPAKADEITGLEALFSAQTLYGVSKNENSIMNPCMEECEDITIGDIQKMIDTIEETSGDKVNFIVCSWGVKRALVEHFRENHMTTNSMELNSGYTALNFDGIPIVADRFCPSGTMYFLNTNDFKLHQLCDWEWLEGEDGKVLKQVPGKPVYTATLVKYAELICERPCGQGKLYNITER